MLVRRGIRFIPYYLCEMKRREAIKGKTRRAQDHLTPSIVHMPLYRCLCAILSVIDSDTNDNRQ